MDVELLSDSEISAIASRISERKQRVIDLMREIADVKRFERELKAFLNEKPVEPRGTAGRPESQAPSSSTEILDAAEAVLREKGGSMYSSQILEEITARGVRVGGKNPAVNLSTKLGRSNGRFISNGRRMGWRLPLSDDSEAGRHTATPQVRFRLADPRDSPQPTRRRYRLIPLWIGALKTIASTPEGITSHEVGRLLDGVRQAGLGRVTIPIKKVLEQHGLDDWQEIIDKGREDEGVMWRPGPRIKDAIQALEAEALKRASPPE